MLFSYVSSSIDDFFRVGTKSQRESLRRFALALTLSMFAVSLAANVAMAQVRRGGGLTEARNTKFNQEDKFRQLEEILPTPNEYRTASGAPGHKYWQQKVDYRIDVTLNEDPRTLDGSELITYQNNSPDTLKYLWLQLDGNRFLGNSDDALTTTALDPTRVPFDFLPRMKTAVEGGGGVQIKLVKDASNDQDLAYTIVKTMMRIDLPTPLQPSESTQFQVDWNYKIVDSKLVSSRGAYELFEDGNCIFEIAQWFPRLCSYTDVNGWQHKQFLGRGEFALEFGDYIVSITAPEDHIVGATGEILNMDQVLTESQMGRYKESRTAPEPMFIVTPEEAKANEKDKSEGKKTWIFKADNVRDFAFASSRKFIWDAQGVDVMGNKVMAMSLYPNEGEPLWSKFSTQAIIHTLNVYSRFTFRYPYPVAYSVNGPIGGMEYPMICFNGPRPEKDGTYSERTKLGLIGVVIHEVGHNYFPMIVNSDERQWTWMDEGLNTFLQVLAEREWEEGYPVRRGEPRDIVGYMTSNDQVPIMTNSESILQFGPNAYSKPAAGLTILRETIMGRELFDYSFKEYSQRWMFRRPMPADFFRTMEDASGVDLDWFWKGWFYTTDHVDLAISDVRQFNINSMEPEFEKGILREQREAVPPSLTVKRNEGMAPMRSEDHPGILDFYSTYDELEVTNRDKASYKQMLSGLTDSEKEMLSSTMNFYVVDVRNLGGLVMPVLLQFTYEDGSKEDLRIPAEIWRRDHEKVSKMFMTDKVVTNVELDPQLETADAERDNNYFPPQISKSRFELFKGGRGGRGAGVRAGGPGAFDGNPMQAAKQAEEAKNRPKRPRGARGRAEDAASDQSDDQGQEDKSEDKSEAADEAKVDDDGTISETATETESKTEVKTEAKTETDTKTKTETDTKTEVKSETTPPGGEVKAQATATAVSSEVGK